MSKSAKVFAAVYFLLCSTIVAIGSLIPGSQGLVAVFAKPWGENALEVIAHADGQVIFVNDSTWIALTEVRNSDDVARLYKSGAGFVASSLVAQACARWSAISLGSST